MKNRNHDCLKSQLKISIRSDDAFVPQGLFEGVRLTLEVVLLEQWLGQLKQFLRRCFCRKQFSKKDTKCNGDKVKILFDRACIVC